MSRLAIISLSALLLMLPAFMLWDDATSIAMESVVHEVPAPSEETQEISTSQARS